MLVAEIHGKRIPEATNHEDYLTSAVFGHLRYVGPQIFWQELFGRAICLSERKQNLQAAVLASSGRQLSSFNTLQVHFWANHPSLGEPDILLCFHSEDSLPVVVVLEAKLFSGKSGRGEWDQLWRYLRLLDDLPATRLDLPDACLPLLVYLTPRDATAEAEESLQVSGNCQLDRERLFLLRWQDIAEVAQSVAIDASGYVRMILTDVQRFLQKRGLVSFDGFRRIADLQEITVKKLNCSNVDNGSFCGFRKVNDFDLIEPRTMAYG